MSETDLNIWQTGVVRAFKLVPYNPDLHANVLGFYNDKEVEYLIREKKKKPTLETHAYYRGIIIPVCMQSEVFGGWKRDKIHRYFAGLFLKDVETFEVGGDVHFQEHILSTSSISKKEMGVFIDEVRRYLLEKHNIVTPDPVKQ